MKNIGFLTIAICSILATIVLVTIAVVCWRLVGTLRHHQPKDCVIDTLKSGVIQVLLVLIFCSGVAAITCFASELNNQGWILLCACLFLVSIFSYTDCLLETLFFSGIILILLFFFPIKNLNNRLMPDIEKMVYINGVTVDTTMHCSCIKEDTACFTAPTKPVYITRFTKCPICHHRYYLHHPTTTLLTRKEYNERERRIRHDVAMELPDPPWN